MKPRRSCPLPIALVVLPLLAALVLALLFSAGVRAAAAAAPDAGAGPAAAAAASADLRAAAAGTAPLARGRKPRLPRRRGGRVRRVWPAGKTGRPDTALERWLARQVGGVAPRKRGGKGRGSAGVAAAGAAASVAPAAAVGAPARESAPWVAADTPQKLALVRSYDIPADDPSAERLLNLSWTYDSAIAAIAFMARGERGQAEQLLDQLAAVQRVDGSIDFAFNTFTGASEPLFRSGTIAWIGLAALTYRRQYGSTRYDTLIRGAARWLYQQREANGLLRGGPDVRWQSTQHNLVAYFLLRGWARTAAASVAAAKVSPVLECVDQAVGGGLTAVWGYSNPNAYAVTIAQGSGNGFSPSAAGGRQPTVFMPGRQQAVFRVPITGTTVWSLNGKTATASPSSTRCDGPRPPVTTVDPTLAEYDAAASAIAAGLRKLTLVDGRRFVQGVGDGVRPLDVQTLGSLFLLDQAGSDKAATAEAAAVVATATKDYPVEDVSVARSKDSATFNMTYEAKGPFAGYRPYADRGAPDVLWAEGTAQMRFALDEARRRGKAGIKVGENLADEIQRWLKITSDRGEGPLGASRTVTGNPFNEYHVWPTSAAGSWVLIGTGKTQAFTTS